MCRNSNHKPSPFSHFPLPFLRKATQMNDIVLSVFDALKSGSHSFEGEKFTVENVRYGSMS